MEQLRHIPAALPRRPIRWPGRRPARQRPPRLDPDVELTRRHDSGRLKGALLTAGLLLLSSSALRAQERTFDLVPLEDGIWAAVVVPNPPSYAFANSLIVLSDEGVLVVDTQQSPSAARALIREIRALSDKPVRWVVHTHWHADHVWGNQAYREAWPAVSFIAQRRTRERLEEAGRSEVEAQLRSLPDRIAQREAWLETGRGPDGEALTPDQLASVRYSLDVNRGYLEELGGLELVLPDVVFDDRLTLHLGPTVLELVYVGPAHTEGDLVVRLPDRGIVAVGDLVEAAPPYLEHGDLEGWARALERILATEPTTVVAAHAAPDQGVELLRWQGDFFRALVDRVQAALADGAPGDGVADRVLMDDFRGRFEALGVGGDAYARWVRSAVDQAAEQLSGAGG